MDTSEEYVKMADCPEIQKDKVTIRNKDYFVHIETKRKAYYVWLPRQDQIQEMIERFMAETKNWRGVWALEQSFHHWFLEEAKINVGATMEQLWLAFYMYEKHKKGWDGNKWIK